MSRWKPLGIINDTEYCAYPHSVLISQDGNQVCLTEEELKELLCIVETETERVKRG